MRGRQFASPCHRVFAIESNGVNELEDNVDQVLDNNFARLGHSSVIREAVQSVLDSSYCAS